MGALCGVPQGVQFKTTFKILPLKCYDIILGMDWLEKYSPMEVQWAEKWMSFWHGKQRVKLQGLVPKGGSCQTINGDQFFAMQKQNEIWCVVQIYSMDSPQQLDTEPLPAGMKELVQKNADLFTEPYGLPPSRAHDHVIPLICGTQPFRLRP